MLQLTAALNVPVPLTVAVKLEVAPEAMVAGLATNTHMKFIPILFISMIICIC